MQKVNSLSYDFILNLTPSLESSLDELKTSSSDLCLSLCTSPFHLSSLSAVFASWRSKSRRCRAEMNLYNAAEAWWMSLLDLRSPVASGCFLLHDFIWSDLTRAAGVFDLTRVFYDKQRNVLKPTSFMGVEQDLKGAFFYTLNQEEFQDGTTFCVSNAFHLKPEAVVLHYFGPDCCIFVRSTLVLL